MITLKKTLGWILAILGFSAFTGVLIFISDLKTVLLTYLLTTLFVGFIALVVWFIMDDD